MTEDSTKQNGLTRSISRKRKRGIVCQYKKFGTQGKLGRGFKINSDTYGYFLRIFELLKKDDFETEDERDLLVDNAFIQTENEEVHLSCNQFTSRVLELLITWSKNEEVLHRFSSSLTVSLRTICIDPYASHVLEKLLEVISEKWARNKMLTTWFQSTSKYIINNYEEFVFDKYANHCMRKVCQCLSGAVHLFSAKLQQHNASSVRLPCPIIVRPIPLEMELSDQPLRKFHKKSRKLLKEFATRFLTWPQFGDLLKREVTSGFVQCLLLTLRTIGDDSASNGVTQLQEALDVNEVLQFQWQLHSLEVCLAVASDEPSLFHSTFEKYIKGRMLKFVESESGHYLIERLFFSVPTNEIFDEMFEELETKFSEIWDTKYLSVFTSIAECCRRLQRKQNLFTTKLTELLAVDREMSNENFFEVLLCFGKSFQPKEDGTILFMTELQGCLTTQHILNFHKPYKIVTAVLNLEGSKLSKIAQDPKGSYVMDAFFKSDTVGEKNKEKLILKMREYFVTMACTKFGARVLDNLFSACNLKQKALVASALAPRQAQLNTNFFGKFLATKYALPYYNRNQAEWTRAITKSS